VVARVADHFLGAAHRQRRLGRNRRGDFAHALAQGFRRFEYTVHQAHLLGLDAVEFTGGVGQLARHAFADQARQTLQGAHVRHHADVDFLDGEPRIRRAVAHVGAADQINPATDARAMHGRQHRLAAALQAGQRILQIENHAAQVFARAAVALVAHLRAYAHHHLQVDAGGEGLALAF
jgi:hypothetical protein